MLGEFIKRLFNVVVLGLAVLALFFVPLGRRTPAQHIVAILETPPAREAASALADAAHRVVAQVRAEVEDATHTEPRRR